MKKVIKVLTVVILFSLILTNFSFAAKKATATATDINSFLGYGDEIDEVIQKEEDALNSVLSIVQAIGISVATIMLLVLGIKYMISSVSDRAEIKKHAVIYITGAMLLFGASAIMQIVKSFAGNLKA